MNRNKIDMRNFRQGKFPMTSAKANFWLNHRNGKGFVEYARIQFDHESQKDKFYISGGWCPETQFEQAVKSIKRAIRITIDSEKPIGHAFLNEFITKYGSKNVS
jgi:hypothetical protein